MICKRGGIYYEVDGARWRAWIGARGEYGRAGAGWNTGEVVIIGAEIESDPPSYRENEIERHTSRGYWVKPHDGVAHESLYGKWTGEAWHWEADCQRRVFQDRALGYADYVQADIERVKRQAGNYSCWREGEDEICDVANGIVDVHCEGGG